MTDDLKPLTDEELHIVDRIQRGLDEGTFDYHDEEGVRLLLAEVRRLRAERYHARITYGVELRLSVPGDVKRVYVNGRPFVPERWRVTCECGRGEVFVWSDLAIYRCLCGRQHYKP